VSPTYYRAIHGNRKRLEEVTVSGWIDELAAAFAQDALNDDETRQLLGVSREVAHRVERKETPLAAFLVGMGVAQRVAEGEARAAAIAGAIERIQAMLPPAPDPA
jgi:Domain of unknown function (DUF6457)